MAKPANGTPGGIGHSGAIHLTLQGKGGVGKSLIASVLAQYFLRKGVAVRCVDTDPVNRTLAQYSALGADWLSLRDEHNRIDQRAFDGLMERFLTEEVPRSSSTMAHLRSCPCGTTYWRTTASNTYGSRGWKLPSMSPLCRCLS
jgi:hypothetical protein